MSNEMSLQRYMETVVGASSVLHAVIENRLLSDREITDFLYNAEQRSGVVQHNLRECIANEMRTIASGMIVTGEGYWGATVGDHGSAEALVAEFNFADRSAVEVWLSEAEKEAQTVGISFALLPADIRERAIDEICEAIE